MSRRALAVALAAACAIAIAPRPAAAVYQCGPQKDECQCGKDNPYPCCDNGGNCTWWAWEGACCGWAIGLPGWGNANQWVGNAANHPDFLVLGAPVASSVGCRVSGEYGHVVWVMSVSGGDIHVSEQNCWGGWGMREWDYKASYFDGGFIVPKSKCECTPGQTQSEGCGRCGTRTRGCDGCTWGGWGGCEGEGPCDPGQAEEQACGDCGKQARTCNPSCQWDGFGACAGPDPGDGQVACETGQKGACAAGTQRCVDGTVQCAAKATPTSEACNAVDDDCDGEVDEGACDAPARDAGGGSSEDDAGTVWVGEGDAGAPPFGGGAGGAAALEADANGDLVGGCACATPGDRSRPAGAFAALAALVVAVGGAAARRARRPAR